MTRNAFRIDIYGIVQGVGFRPFIYRLANELSLSGYVSNTSKGVSVFIETERQTLDKFVDLVNKQKPNISMIDHIDITETGPLGLSGFFIEKSKKDETNEVFISADLSTCSYCKKDILNEKNRRFEYPFTTCTYCGPRYSIITDIPYDRVNTVMGEFIMCKECQAEYDNPDNRRFHSQPNACPACGPWLFLFNTGLQDFEKVADPIDFAAKRIAEGKIIALKGLGGYQLCCDATDNQAVAQLRQRKLREAKPFAVMCRDMDVVKEYCYMSEAEQQLVLTPKNPIVLLERRQNTDLAGQVSIDNNFIGVMLPYTPLHILLMRCFKVLVMTSANISDKPIIIDDEEAKQKLSKISDYIIMHNRKIKNRVDDSVYKVINDKPQAIRRARGFVPGMLKVPGLKKTILAVGGELKNTFAINRAENVFVGPHSGDLKNSETFDFFKQSITEFQRIYKLIPEVIACDRHPLYMSTGFAKENFTGIPVVEVQHHHAHLVSALAENGLSGPAIGISMDGTGFGADGAIWGCEAGIVTKKDFLRKGHLDYFYLPGGDKCADEIYRCALAFLYGLNKDFDLKSFKFLSSISEEQVNFLCKMMDKKISIYSTSSMGRFFDGVSSLIGLGNFSKYEASAAIVLEKIADKDVYDSYPVDIRKGNDLYLWHWRPIIEEIIYDISKEEPASTISSKFHNCVVNYICEMTDILCQETGLSEVVLSGGVFYNSWISSKAEKKLLEKGYRVYLQRIFPAGDGGIALGQLIIANEVI